MIVTLLVIGDVVGRPGRFVLSQALPVLVKQHGVDCVIANVENAAGGSGCTPQLFEKFRRYGVDLMTLGDHAFRKMEIAPILESSDRIVRPANFPRKAPGREYLMHQTAGGVRIAVITLLGQLFMKPNINCPFVTIDRLLSQIGNDAQIIVVEIHAEATSEKVAMGWYLDGRAAVVFGTHTHIPTADESILPAGTAYITDLGMTGPYDSVLGRRKDRVLHHLLTGTPASFDVAEGDARLCGILVKYELTTKRAVSIERITVTEKDVAEMTAASGGAAENDSNDE